jgi:hypothetical protein
MYFKKNGSNKTIYENMKTTVLPPQYFCLKLHQNL